MMQSLNFVRTLYVEVIHINDFPVFDESGHDFLIYNAFANEKNLLKFDKNLVEVTDEKFHNFKGKKLLFDTYDDGNMDGFERFHDFTTPRAKITPGYEFVKSYNVIIPIPFTADWAFFIKDSDVKTINLLYCVAIRGYGHNIRRIVFNKLIPFNPYRQRHPQREYPAVLRSAKISVTVPGWGPGCKSQVEALAAKCLLFAHDSIKKVKILPFGELVDGRDYISFSLDNMEDRLSAIISDRDKIQAISANGLSLFREAYDPKRTAKQIEEYFS